MNFNDLSCESSKRNVGFGSCVVDLGTFAGFIFSDSPKVWTDAELEDPLATLQEMIAADDKSVRFFPINDVFQWTDNSEDVTIQTSDLGKKVFVKDGDYDWTSQHTKGALCLLEAIQSHNGYVYMHYIAKPGSLGGSKAKLLGTNQNGSFATIPVLLHALKWKMATGSAVAEYLVRHIIDNAYLNNGNLAYKEMNLGDLLALQGLQDLQIVVNSFNDTTGVVNISIKTACGGANVGATHNAEFANIARYSAQNAETGGAIGITSATYFANNKTFDVTLDTGDADYPEDGNIDFDLVGTAALRAAGIEGYESIGPVTLEVINS